MLTSHTQKTTKMDIGNHPDLKNPKFISANYPCMLRACFLHSPCMFCARSMHIPCKLHAHSMNILDRSVSTTQTWKNIRTNSVNHPDLKNIKLDSANHPDLEVKLESANCPDLEKQNWTVQNTKTWKTTKLICAYHRDLKNLLIEKCQQTVHALFMFCAWTVPTTQTWKTTNLDSAKKPDLKKLQCQPPGPVKQQNWTVPTI